MMMIIYMYVFAETTTTTIAQRCWRSQRQNPVHSTAENCPVLYIVYTTARPATRPSKKHITGLILLKTGFYCINGVIRGPLREPMRDEG